MESDAAALQSPLARPSRTPLPRRCRRVCKEWRDASGNERLWRRHCRRVCRLNMDRDLFDKTRAQAKALHSWRLAYPRVPQVHSTGEHRESTRLRAACARPQLSA